MEDWEKSARPLNENEYIGDATMGASPADDVISEVAPNMSDVALETAQDMGMVAGQTMTFELLDDVMEKVDPDLARAYRRKVAEARGRSPIATTVYDVVGPDFISIATGGLSKIEKARKLRSLLNKHSVATSAATGATTSAAVQLGTEGEVDLMEAGLVGLGSGATTKGMEFLIPKVASKSRSKYVAMDALMNDPEFQDAAKRANMKLPDYVDHVLEELAEMGVFKGSEFDQASLKFIPSGRMEKGTRALLPPSTEEMSVNVRKAKEAIYKEIESMIKANSRVAREGSRHIIKEQEEKIEALRKALRGYKFGDKFNEKSNKVAENLMKEIEGRERNLQQLKSSDISYPRKGVATENEVLPLDISDEIKGRLKFKDANEEKMVDTVVDYLRDKYFHTGGELSLEQLNSFRREIDEAINWSKASVDDTTKVKNAILVQVRRRARNLINEKLPNQGRIQELNKKYTNLSRMEDALDIRQIMKYKDTDVVPSHLFMLSPAYATASGVERGIRNRTYQGIAGQVRETMESTPTSETLFKEPVMNPLRHLAPTYLKQDHIDKGKQEEPFPFAKPIDPQASNTMTPKAPQNLVEIINQKKIPRTTEGILNNIPLLKAKMAQKFNDPQLLQWVDKHTADPERLKEKAPAIIENPMFQDFFEFDKYARVDGQVPHSMKNKAKRDIELEPQSNHELVDRLDALNRHRRLV